MSIVWRRLLSHDCCRSTNYCLCASFVSKSRIMGSFWLRSTIVPIFFIPQLNQVEVNLKRVWIPKAIINKPYLKVLLSDSFRVYSKNASNPSIRIYEYYIFINVNVKLNLFSQPNYKRKPK